MGARLIIAVLLIFLLLPSSGYAEEISPIDKLDQISDEALQMIKLHRYEDAKKMLEYFSNQFVAINGYDRSLTMDERRIVTVSHNEAVEAATNTGMNHDERLNRVIKFRLVMDTISSSSEPLWTEMEEPLMTAFGQMKEAVYSGDQEKFHTKLNTFLSLYDVIYPSMKLDIESSQVQKLDTHIAFIDHYRSQILSKEASQQEFEGLESDLELIFDEQKEDEADPSLWWIIISTGSIIILTLSYVGWRKYIGGKEKEKYPENE